MVNTIDDKAFDPTKQVTFANAFYQAVFPSPTYEADALNVSLDNIVALGTAHPIDYLNIATHGIVSCRQSTCTYHWTSGQEVTEASNVTYSSEIRAKRIVPGNILTNHRATPLPHVLVYWFSPQFLMAHVTFNPGAILINSSCFGQSSELSSAMPSTLSSTGIGLYAGWTGYAEASDADQSDAYLVDRLLGEQAPVVNGLSAIRYTSASPLLLIN